MKVFINGSSAISPQDTFQSEGLPSVLAEYEGSRLSCIEPDYKEYIKPRAARRMSKVVKMGVTASKQTLQKASIDLPDAIITGTGLGCWKDTEKFLESMIENEENLLNPTSFIQSTHNTVGGQIALTLGCNEYNFTYVHRGFSFSSAMLDGAMMLEEGKGNNILVGGFDELTDKWFQITNRVDLWKKEACKNTEMLASGTSGALGGEGAGFFILSNEQQGSTLAQLNGLDQFYKPANKQEVVERTKAFLKRHSLESDDVDAVIYGYSGDKEFDPIYDEVRQAVFPESVSLYYKHACGEYHTASAFGMWLGTKILHEQHVPDWAFLNEGDSLGDGEIKKILLYDNYRNLDHSLFLLSR